MAKRSTRLLSSGFKTRIMRYTPSGEAKRIKPVYIDFTPTEKQRELIENPAFETFFGGAAGGGKSFALVMMALCYHEKAIIFRREYPQLKELIAVAKKATYQKGKFNQRDKILSLNDGRFLEFGGLQYEDDKENFQGRPHDFMGFDEITHMTKSQYEYLRGWARTENPNQRVRIVCTGNPPTTAQGQWVREHWSPWLDPNHANPAESGEIRYYARLGDDEIEVDSPEPILHEGETITPVSRTFIRSMVEDNPYYMATGYRETLLSLPAPLRDKLLYGDFSGAMDENHYQLIPTSWFELALDNYEKNKNADPLPLTQIGVDCARGGQDKTVLAFRYGSKEFGRKRFELVKILGRHTPDGQSIAQQIMKYHQPGVKVNIDVIGIGASAYDQTREYIPYDVAPVNFSVVSQDKDRTGRLEFINIRAEFYWRLREQLDYENSPIQIELPPDKELRRDALSIQWGLGRQGVKIESKDELIARTGASPDCMDAIVYADAEGRAKKKPSQSKYRH